MKIILTINGILRKSFVLPCGFFTKTDTSRLFWRMSYTAILVKLFIGGIREGLAELADKDHELKPLKTRAYSIVAHGGL